MTTFVKRVAKQLPYVRQLVRQRDRLAAEAGQLEAELVHLRGLAEPGGLCFRCNVCGQVNGGRVGDFRRDVPSCHRCGSNLRCRTLIHWLSTELFGRSLCLTEFPVRPDLRGLSLSDWDVLAAGLAEKFDYTNSFYHCEPRLDIATLEGSVTGPFDFIIASEVFEHVPPPVSRAFENLRRLLRPGGTVLFSVPYRVGRPHVEHFPELHEFRIEREGAAGYVLHNTTRDGRMQTFRDLIFHGGPGSTLEMRCFSLDSLLEEFHRAGFARVRVCEGSVFEWGICWGGDVCSLPMVAKLS